jgi:hypothetical protein
LCRAARKIDIEKPQWTPVGYKKVGVGGVFFSCQAGVGYSSLGIAFGVNHELTG